MHWKNAQDPHTRAVRVGAFARMYHAMHRFARSGIFESDDASFAARHPGGLSWRLTRRPYPGTRAFEVRERASEREAPIGRARARAPSMCERARARAPL